jgi:hypothetical protein
MSLIGTNMKITQPSSKCLTETNKIDIEELERTILTALMSDDRFNGLPLPCAVLSVRDDTVELGVSNKLHDAIVGNYCNYLAQRKFDELMPKLLSKGMRYRIVRAEEASIEAGKRIEVSREVENQKMAGQCNIVPFPVSDPTKKIRTELTIERHAFFVSNTYKGNSRVYDREIRDPETGEPIIQRIMIGCTPENSRREYGVLRQVHQEVLYKLFSLWADQGYKITEIAEFHYGSITTSAYQLVKYLCGRDSVNDYNWVRTILRDMEHTPIVIKSAYTWQGVQDLNDFCILKTEWCGIPIDKNTLRPKTDGESKVQILFSSYITQGFLRKNIKSFAMNPYLCLKDKGRKGLAKLLYSMFDYELANKEEYHISLSSLADRLGTTKYKFKSLQRQKMEPSIKSLNGALILDSKFKLAVSLRDSQRKNDFVLDAKRIPV